MNQDLMVFIQEIIYEKQLKKEQYENTGTHWIALFVKPKYIV